MGDKEVSLVLSSGGARGMAHIGAIEALEEKGYEIVSVSGSSVGALVGGIYATGQLAKFKDWICNLDRIDVFSLMDFTLSSKGFIKGEKVFDALKKLVKDCEIETLDIPFNCTAVELPSGTERVFDSGSLYQAIRASVSIPTVFTPAQIGDREYIDGGLLNPIPFSLVPEGRSTGVVVAVDLNGPRDALVQPLSGGKNNSSIKLPVWMKDYQKKVSHYFYKEERIQKAEKPKSMGSLDILNYSFDLLQDKLSAMVIDRYRVDVLVEVSREQAGTLEFYKARQLIEVGYNKMKEAINDYENGSGTTQ